MLAAALLARSALPREGSLLVLVLAALCPAMVLGGVVWSPQALAIPLAATTAWLLHRVLLHPDSRSRAWLALSTTLLLAVDWPLWPPVLAWMGWLLFFRPEWLPRERAVGALQVLGLGAGVAGLGYAALLLGGADPTRALSTRELPLGPEALLALVDAGAAPWLGLGRGHPLALRAAIAVAVAATILVGWQRARRAGSGPWASVLVVGSAGAFIPALAFHPLVPYAADKNLWYTSPMLLCLAAAAVWPIDRFDPSEPSSSPTRRTALAAGALVLLLGLVACSPDEDEDGWTLDAGDCDDSNPDVHPEAPELWQDGIDNDCDGLEDVSDDYVFVEEQEPNDTSLGSCFSPDGQDIGHLAGAGLLTRFSGRIDSVVDASYTEGDLDCIAFRVPEHVEHPRLYVTLSWLEEDSDLDLAVQGIWEGEQVAFGLSQAPGPSPEVLISSSGFDPTTPLWLWLAGYDGPPTDYELDLVLR